MINIENVVDAVIEISFDEPFGIHGEDPCPTDYLQVLDGVEENSASLGKYCSVYAPEPIITSSSRATVIFQGSTNQQSRVGVSVSYEVKFVGRLIVIGMDNGVTPYHTVHIQF